MPYIAQNRRHDVGIDVDNNMPAVDAGELNFQLTQVIIGYAKNHNNYQGMNDILGALEGAKTEFYRRWIVPHEDYKIAVNGDVYPTGEA